MAPYHIVVISSVIPENLVLLTKSEQFGPKSAHIRPTIKQIRARVIYSARKAKHLDATTMFTDSHANTRPIRARGLRDGRLANLSGVAGGGEVQNK